MALTKTVTKLRPVIDRRNIARVGIHLLLQDDGVTVIDQDVTETYAPNAPIEPIQAELTTRAQALIDQYINEKELHGKAAYTNAVAGIDAALDITEN